MLHEASYSSDIYTYRIKDLHQETSKHTSVQLLVTFVLGAWCSTYNQLMEVPCSTFLLLWYKQILFVLVGN